MKIILHKERPQSWNMIYSGRHWSNRSNEATRIHNLVHWELKAMGIHPQDRTKIFTNKVAIIITVFFAKTPLDPDNIPGKIYIDGLKDFLLIDDSYKYISSVTTMSKIDRKKPRVEIDVVETEP